MRRRAWAAVALAATLAACSRGDGRTLQEPEPGATAPPRTTAVAGPTAGISPSPSAAMRLASDVIVEGRAIPTTYSCVGENISPPLQWSGVPSDAAALGLTVTDLDANGFVHWVVWNIPSDTSQAAEGAAPPGAEGRNDAGTVGWTGPCPPANEAHRYLFVVHALRRSLELDADARPKQAVAAIEGASLAQARITATFVRQ